MGEQFDEDFYKRNLNPRPWFLLSDEERQQIAETLGELEEAFAETGLTEDELVELLQQRSIAQDRHDFVDAVMDDMEQITEVAEE